MCGKNIAALIELIKYARFNRTRTRTHHIRKTWNCKWISLTLTATAATAHRKHQRTTNHRMRLSKTPHRMIFILFFYHRSTGFMRSCYTYKYKLEFYSPCSERVRQWVQSAREMVRKSRNFPTSSRPSAATKLFVRISWFESHTEHRRTKRCGNLWAKTSTLSAIGLTGSEISPETIWLRVRWAVHVFHVQYRWKSHDICFHARFNWILSAVLVLMQPHTRSLRTHTQTQTRAMSVDCGSKWQQRRVRKAFLA